MSFDGVEETSCIQTIRRQRLSEKSFARNKVHGANKSLTLARKERAGWGSWPKPRRLDTCRGIQIGRIESAGSGDSGRTLAASSLSKRTQRRPPLTRLNFTFSLYLLIVVDGDQRSSPSLRTDGDLTRPKPESIKSTLFSLSYPNMVFSPCHHYHGF